MCVTLYVVKEIVRTMLKPQSYLKPPSHESWYSDLACSSVMSGLPAIRENIDYSKHLSTELWPRQCWTLDCGTHELDKSCAMILSAMSEMGARRLITLNHLSDGE